MGEWLKSNVITRLFHFRFDVVSAVDVRLSAWFSGTESALLNQVGPGSILTESLFLGRCWLLWISVCSANG